MNNVITYVGSHIQAFGAYALIIFMVGVFVAEIITYFRIKTFSLNIEEEFIQSKGLFGIKKIFYRDINFIKFSNYVDSTDTPNFNIYIDISTAHKERMYFFMDSLQSGDFERLFMHIVNNSESYKNNTDFMKFSKGEYTFEDLYRLAGVLDSYNFTYKVDLLDTKGSFLLNFLKYLIIAGVVLFVILFVLIFCSYIIFSGS